MPDTTPQCTIHFDGRLTVTLHGEHFASALADAIAQLLPHTSITHTPAAAAAAPALVPAVAVDTSAPAVAAADTAAASTGWTVALAQAWDTYDSSVGRTALRTLVAAGGTLIPAEMATALDRDITAPHTFTGVFSGTAKRFKQFQGNEAGASALPYPVVTEYSAHIAGRQTAKAFSLPAGTLAVFQVAYALIDAAAAA